MKILHLSEYYLKGYSYQENKLPHIQAKLGNKVFFIASNKKYFDYQENYSQNNFFEEEVEFTLIKPKLEIKKNKKVLFNFIELYKKINEIAPEVIHIHGEKNLMILSAIKYKKKYPNTKIVIDCHADKINSPLLMNKKGRLLFKNKFFKKWYIHFIYRYVEKYLPIDYASKDYLKNFLEGIVEEEKITINKLGAVNPKIFDKKNIQLRKNLNISSNDIVFINTGKLFKKHKHVDELIIAFNELNKEVHNIKLILVGILDEEIKLLLSEYNNDNIIFCTFIKAEQLYEYYVISDIGVWTSASNSILEIMSYSKPLILKNTNTLEHLINGNGYLYDSINDLKNKMKLLLDENERKRASVRSYDYFKENFSWEKIAKETLDIYKN